MAELSARARVLSDIFSESVRLAGGTPSGVPARVVQPLKTATAMDLRALALASAGEGGGRTGAALEGRWEGTLEVGDPRPMAIRFRIEGGKLAGGFSSQTSKLTVTTKLVDITYARGNVRFAIDFQGARWTFAGTIAGNDITGTAQRGIGPSAPSGPFSLRYVE